MIRDDFSYWAETHSNNPSDIDAFQSIMEEKHICPDLLVLSDRTPTFISYQVDENEGSIEYSSADEDLMKITMERFSMDHPDALVQLELINETDHAEGGLLLWANGALAVDRSRRVIGTDHSLDQPTVQVIVELIQRNPQLSGPELVKLIENEYQADHIAVIRANYGKDVTQ